MKKSITRGIIGILFMISILIMTSCSNDRQISEETNEQSFQSDGRYVCTGYEKISWEDGTPCVLACAENMVYSVVPNFYYENESIAAENIEELVEDYEQFRVTCKVFRHEIMDTALSQAVLLGEMEGFALDAVITPDGNLILALESAQTYLGLQNDCFLIRIDVEGKIQYRTMLENGFTPSMLAANVDNGVYLLSNNRVYYINAKGKCVKKIDFDSPGMEIITDGKQGFYLTRLGLSLPMEIVRVQNGKEELISFEQQGFYRMSQTGAGKLVIGNQKKAYLYSEKDCKWEEFIAFPELDICFDDTKKWWFDKNETLYMIMKDDWSSEDYLLTAHLKPKKEVKTKETITLGIWGTNSEFLRMVTRFNRGHDFRVDIIDYSEKNKEYTADNSGNTLEDRLELEFLSGKGPDILCTNCMDFRLLTNQGLLEDLSFYLENSESLKREDFYEELLKSASYGDILAYLPVDFEIQTIFGKMDILKEFENWRLEDLLQLADEHSQAYLMAPNIYVKEEGADSLLRMFFLFNQDELHKVLDENYLWKDKTLMILLEKAKEVYQARENTESNLQEGYRTNMILLKQLSISSFLEISNIGQQEFGKESIRIIGYPTPEGEKGNLIRPRTGFGMMKNCNNKRAAWQFLEYLLMQESETPIYFSANPVYFKLQLKKIRNYASMDMSEPELELLDRNIRLLEECVNSARGYYGVIDEKIMNIVGEEAHSFYYEDKALEDVIDVIKNRVKLYVEENGD